MSNGSMNNYKICYVESRRIFWVRHLLHRLVRRLKRQGRFPTQPRLVAFPNDLIGRELAVAGAYEPYGIQAMRWMCESGIVAHARDSVFLDVGANIGMYSTAMADCFAEVLAFEPHPLTAKVLTLNVEINQLDNVHVHQIALSDQDGYADLFDAGHDNVGASSLERRQEQGEAHRVVLQRGAPVVCDSTSLRVALIKLDVEGHELKAINGLSELIAAQLPVLAFELNDSTLAVLLPARLRELGYETFIALDFWPSVSSLPLRVLLLTLFGVRHALRPVASLEGKTYPLVFALSPEQSALWNSSLR